MLLLTSAFDYNTPQSVD